LQSIEQITIVNMI